MNGGGPVLANACTAFAATTTNNSQPVVRSMGRNSRSTRRGAPSGSVATSTPTSTSVVQKMKNDHVYVWAPRIDRLNPCPMSRARCNDECRMPM
jgi:hypothetical protein